MLLRDPYALHTLCKSILHNMLELFEKAQLPRVSQQTGKCMGKPLNKDTEGSTILCH